MAEAVTRDALKSTYMSSAYTAATTGTRLDRSACRLCV